MPNKKSDESRFDPSELLKQFLQAASGAGEGPDGGRKALGQAVREVSTRLRKQAKSAISEFKEHLSQVRASLPPMAVRLLPAEDTRWTSEPEACRRIAALRAAGFEQVGVFRLDVIHHYSFVGFVHPQQAIQAQVTQTREAIVLELSSLYADGSVCECLDLARKAGHPPVPWVTSHRLPGLAPGELIGEFLKRRPSTNLVPATTDDFARRIEAGFHRVQCWRAERGGFTPDEIREMKGLGHDPEALEQVEMLRHDNAERWLCNWLKTRADLPFKLEDVLESLVIVHGEMSPDRVANAWWCGTGDFGLRSGEFEGPRPLEVFRETNRKRGEPLRRIVQKPAPFAADFYLPRETHGKARKGSKLAQAIEKGLANGDLRGALFELGDYELESEADAQAACEALSALKRVATPNFVRQVQALTRLFQQVPDRQSAAFARFRDQGVPLLLGRFEEVRTAADSGAGMVAMLMLRTLAHFETADGTKKVIETARAGFEEESLAWTGVFGEYKPGHPQADHLFAALANPLPPGSIAGALLTVVNNMLLGGGNVPHPFDNPAGRKRLLSWIRNPDPERSGEAQTATATLPFLAEEGRDKLLAAAGRHPDPGVRMEAAWASAKLGQDDGLQRLVESCGHWRSTSAAQQYLRELGREDLIPASIQEPSFAALARMCDWLAHPNELGRVPDELEIADHRRLAWPPERVEKPFWVIRYRLRPEAGGEQESEDDDVGFGLVGSITFCLFSTNLVSRPPEDVYAVHCFWEMEQKDLVSEESVDEEDAAQHAGLLRQWRGEPLQNPVVVRLVKLSSALKYPRRVAGLARAGQGGKAGYAILDGDRSVWQRAVRVKKGQVEEQESLILKLHVGRHLLGL